MCCVVVEGKEVLGILEPFMKEMAEELNAIKREMAHVNKRMNDLTEAIDNDREELANKLSDIHATLQSTTPQVDAISRAVISNISPLLSRIENQISDIAAEEDLGE